LLNEVSDVGTTQVHARTTAIQSPSTPSQKATMTVRTATTTNQKASTPDEKQTPAIEKQTTPVHWPTTADQSASTAAPCPTTADLSPSVPVGNAMPWIDSAATSDQKASTAVLALSNARSRRAIAFIVPAFAALR
jgi:hypothetical protein